MEQYLNLLQEILNKGTRKPAARENMPGTTSLFGYQLRHDLSKGFPLLTTKKMSFKNLVVELLWFLRGDVNIKFLIENNCNWWNEDAYNYYVKKCKEYNTPPIFDFENFVKTLRSNDTFNDPDLCRVDSYKLGDCGYQYGKVWRNWETDYHVHKERHYQPLDQIKNVINSLKNTPESRRHIVTAVDPAHDEDLALYWCHSMFQFNCRPIPWETKLELAKNNPNVEMENLAITEAAAGDKRFGNVPQYYLDCHLYQRSADVILGVPYNIASYSLLTHIIARICNMIPGEFIHSFGDVHIYQDHENVVREQLVRSPSKLPTLVIGGTDLVWQELESSGLELLTIDMFSLDNYNPQPAIKAKLSTGMKKP